MTSQVILYTFGVKESTSTRIEGALDFRHRRKNKITNVLPSLRCSFNKVSCCASKDEVSILRFFGGRVGECRLTLIKTVST